MKIAFNLFVRLFVALLAAKLLLGLWGGGSPEALLGLTLGLIGLSYLIKVLEIYYQRTWQSKMAELGWRAARFLIGLNQLGDKQNRP
jgi:hypothetical protein